MTPRPPAPSPGGETVVIYRLGSLGDTIVALPCFHAVARRFPEARRVVLTNAPVSAKAAPLLAVLGEEAGIVHDVLAYPAGARSPLVLWQLLRSLRALKARTLVYMMPDRGAAAGWRDWLFFKLAGFRSILAFPATADLRRNRVDRRTGIVEREAARLVRSFAAFGPIDLADPASWDLRLTPEERVAGRALVSGLAGAPFIAVNMGGKDPSKDWGEGNWQQLFERLRGDFADHGLLVVGAEIDHARGETLIASWPGRAVNGCGILTPRQCAAAMQGAALFVGHDSGPLHLAAAAGARCLGLFGNFNSPRKWHPEGRHVEVIHEMAGMPAIAVADVERAIRRHLMEAADAV